MRVVNKIGWWIKTDNNWQSRWSKRILKKITKQREYYKESVIYTLLDCYAIKTHFWPIYKETIMRKPNYHLDLNYIESNIDEISINNDYKLMWYTDRLGNILGGNVIHILNDVVKCVYRTYNHIQNEKLGYKDFDYYADYELQNYVNELGITSLSRGLMAHPCDNIGLISFKLRTGAMPKFPLNPSFKEITSKDILNLVERFKNIAIFDMVDHSGYYKRINVFAKEENDEYVQLQKICQRANIEVLFNKLN